MSDTDSNNSGFTLIEMSIVLGIISLIIAAVYSGITLIRSSEVRSIVTDVNRYQSAYNSYFNHYDAIPGDMRNAEQYWPGITTNGNGNSRIEAGGEDISAWQHLVLSEMLADKAQYSGTGPVEIGVNIPEAEIYGGGFIMVYGQPYAKAGNMIWAGHGAVAAGVSPVNGILTPPEAEALDKKVDDGKATKGRVGAIEGVSSAAGECVIVADGEFNVANEDDNRVCRVFFELLL